MLWQVSAPNGKEDSGRRVAVLTHPRRPAAIASAVRLVEGLSAAGIDIAMPAEDMAGLGSHLTGRVSELTRPSVEGAAVAELMIVLGGDGTILRGAEWVMASDTPLLGVNLGHVGFLAEAESSEIDWIVERVVERSYRVEERFTIDVQLRDDDDEVVWSSFAINEVSIEKAARERMLEVLVEIDGRPLSRWACDGVLVATPTGSTAYAFSAGGPVIWPGVDAFLVLPLSAHALFARPLVLGPSSRVVVELIPTAQTSAVLWCDGRRSVEIHTGMEVEVVRGRHRLRLARLSQSPFTDRLVNKFGLRVEGWRGLADPDELPHRQQART
jgi:NAD+ kinase